MNCTGDCRTCIDRSAEKYGRAHVADSIATIPHVIPKAGQIFAQHVHAYDHTTFIARGSVRVWLDGELDGDYMAPSGILVPAGVAHRFQALEDDTLFLCIHNIERSGAIEILAGAT